MRAPTRQQAQAANPASSVWVQANAGSGKTRGLVDRVARLLLEGVSPQSILCLTYTKAAASEMQTRLFARLGGWCISSDDQLLSELAELCAPSDSSSALPGRLTPQEQARTARALFAQALETPGGLRIQTIHAFCARLLRRFPLEAGIAPGFCELDEIETARLHRQALQALGLQMARADALAKAIETSTRMAGSQQTLEDLTEKLLASASRLKDFIAAHDGIDTACAVMGEAIGAPPEDADLYAQAMDAALPRERLRSGLSVLEAEGFAKHKTGAILHQVLSEAPAEQKWLEYRKLAFTARGDPAKSNPYNQSMSAKAPQIAELFQIKDLPQGSEIRRIIETEDSLHRHACYKRSAALLRLGQILLQALDSHKRRIGGLDFEDLIQTSLSLLNQSGARDWVRWKLDAEFCDILIDEAQDTSPAQWELLQALSEEFFSGSGKERRKPRTLFAVGDDKQSIYGFQGAAPELFRSEGLRVHTAANAAKLPFSHVELDLSFRSSPPVLEFVDTVFGLPPPEELAEIAENAPEMANIPRHTAHREQAPGYVELWTPEPLPEPDRNDEQTGFVAHTDYTAQTHARTRLATQLAQYLKACLARGETLTDPENGEPRPVRPGDIMILLRGRKSGLFEAILFALQREGLPVAGADRMTLLEQAPVQDILNLVRFALRREDDLVLAELLTSPFCGLDIEQDLFVLAHDRQRASLWSRLAASEKPRHCAARRFLQTALDHAHEPVFEFLTRLLEVPTSGLTGYERLLARFGASACLSIDALLDRALAAEGQAACALQAFLAEIERDTSEIKRDPANMGDEIRVMTIHGAKGSEAPFVILPDNCSAPGKIDPIQFSEHDIPVWLGKKEEDSPYEQSSRAGAKTRALYEHYRLLYVALTRARDRLLICGAWNGTHKTRGYPADSWMARCLAAMETLVTDGRATKAPASESGSAAFRLGETPCPFAPIPEDTSTEPTPVLPDWLERPAPNPPHRARPVTPSGSGTETTPWSQSASVQRQRGVLIHALLEQLPDLPPAQRAGAADTFLARQGPDWPEAERRNIVQSALRVLEHPDYAGLFGPDSRAEVPITAETDGPDGNKYRLHGRIDRLLVSPDLVSAIDFKTSPDLPECAEEVSPDILRQMAAYRQALRASFPDRAVRCLILWTSAPKLMPLPEKLLEACENYPPVR